MSAREENPRYTIDYDHDIRVASWRVAELLLGRDEGTMERDSIESEIMDVLAASFEFTTTNDGPERRADCQAFTSAFLQRLLGTKGGES